jgi:hypothetical protein
MRSTVRFIGVAAIVAASISCGDVVRTGRSPVYLVIDSLQAARGNSQTIFSSVLTSDVVVNVTTPTPPCSVAIPCLTVFNDVGSATLRVSLKDIGSPSTPNTPTTNNDVTITRIHINYRRADGRNTPGVDVPYPFDAAATVTVPASGNATIAFELVRHVAKEESPLVQLRSSPSIINTITEVTFYGRDQVGNEVSVTGLIQINFGNFGDT